MQIACLTTRSTKPSFRFRVERMFPFFTAAGHHCETFFLPAAVWRRLALYPRLARFDVVLLQKRLLSRPELRILRRCARRLVYDVDDAVMYATNGQEHPARRRRFAATARAADLVICGNQFLADETSRETDRVVLVPTAIDTASYQPPLHRAERGRVTIGWTGSRSTNAYLNEVFSVLARLHAPVDMKIISDTIAGFDFSRLGKVASTFVPWGPATEIAEAATFDVGVMPLPDNQWTRGKCGFKALQYMALGIPAVVSPVGVNRDIIHDGLDGFWATTPDEWFQVLARLARDPSLRQSIGHAGRRRVEEAYSLSVHAPRLIRAIEKAAGPLRKSA